jgi:hypothetical protein
VLIASCIGLKDLAFSSDHSLKSHSIFVAHSRFVLPFTCYHTFYNIHGSVIHRCRWNMTRIQLFENFLARARNHTHPLIHSYVLSASPSVAIEPSLINPSFSPLLHRPVTAMSTVVTIANTKKKCAGCGRDDVELKICGGCQAVGYCTSEW